MNLVPLVQNFETVVLAHGAFPSHPTAVAALRMAKVIVCCDGAIDNLLQFGLEPTYIVGDLDSISPELKKRFADRLHQVAEQESNDLTKSIKYCKSNNYNNITILGATGKREDHTLGNIALLADYTNEVNVQMITDYGVLNAISQSAAFESFTGEQVSLFCLTPQTRITLENLRYPLQNAPLQSLWMGTLNEALGASFAVKFDKGEIVIFREHLR